MLRMPLHRAPLLLVAILLAVPAWADAPVADAVRSRIRERGAARVLVQLAEPFQLEGRMATDARLQQRRRLRTARRALLSEVDPQGRRWRREFATIPWLALDVDAADLERLARSPRVAAIQENVRFRPQLAVSVPQIEADQLAALGFDGSGQTIAVIDTGVDAGHDFLQGAVIPAAEACFSSGGNCPLGGTSQFGAGAGVHCLYAQTGCEHGTHVAGIAAGEETGEPSGVAPGATLIPIQVGSESTDTGDCAPTGENPCVIAEAVDVILALEHAYSLRFTYDIASVNVSLGAGQYTSQATCDLLNTATKTAIDNLRSAGIPTVVASGNDSLPNALAAPACISSAISVGATTDYGSVAPYSNSATFLTLLAPGATIRSSVPLDLNSSKYRVKSGTSMAAPHVAGAFAQLRQAVPAATLDEILVALETTGDMIEDSKNGLIKPEIDLIAAYGALLPACDNGVDDDSDGLVDLLDPGCADALDTSETDAALVCDNGLDDDSDGLPDLLDPGCKNGTWPTENPACDDDLDNDGDGQVDWDGDPEGNGDGPALADGYCVNGGAWQTREKPKSSSCGLGFELALLLPALAALRRRAKR